MATSSKKQNPALDKLLDTLEEVIQDGAKGMNAKERRDSEEKFNAALDRAAAARTRRRETA